MSDKLDQEIDLYLEGELTLDEAIRLEERLLEPEAGGALSRELLVRDYLHTLGPEDPPPGLVEYLQSTLPAAGAPKPGRSVWQTTRATVGGVTRTVRGLSTAARTVSTLREPPPSKTKKKSLAFKVLRIGASSMASAFKTKPQPKPWWRRAAGWVS